MLLTSAATDCFPVHRDHAALWTLLSQSVIQAFCQYSGIQQLEHALKSIAVWKYMWYFQKLLQPRLQCVFKIIHIRKFVLVADQATQSSDNNVFQFVADISVACPPLVLQLLKFSQQFCYLYTAPVCHFFILLPCKTYHLSLTKLLLRTHEFLSRRGKEPKAAGGRRGFHAACRPPDPPLTNILCRWSLAGAPRTGFPSVPH